MLQKLKWFFKERWAWNIGAIIFNNIANILVVLSPVVLGKAIDSIAMGEITEKLLNKYIVVLMIMAVTLYLVSIYWSNLVFINGRLIGTKLLISLMQKILYMPKIFFEKYSSGDLITRANTSIESIDEFMGFGMMALVDIIFYMPVIIFVMGFWISWRLTVISIIPLIIVAWLTNYMGKYIYNYYMKQQDAMSDMSSMALEQVVGIRLVRAYALEEKGVQEFERKAKEVYHKSLDSELVANSFWPITNIFLALSYAISLLYGAKLIEEGVITLGKLVTFHIFINFLTWPMYAIGEFVNVSQRGASATEKVYEILEYQEKGGMQYEISPERKDTLYKISKLENIVFKDYSFQYPLSEEKNLLNINIEILKGKTLGIVGKTGSGKTTLIRQLLCEYPIGEGELTGDGISFSEMEKSSLMEHIAYVSQDNILFSKSIRENIGFGMKEENQEILEKAIYLADLSRDIQGFINGLDTLVGERGIAISGGQKQRVAIARAIVKFADILILDDALSAVDTRTEERIIYNIKKVRKNKTTIIISHRLSAVFHADEIIVLEKGKIIERGNHQSLMSENTWYARQFIAQRLEKENE